MPPCAVQRLKRSSCSCAHGVVVMDSTQLLNETKQSEDLFDIALLLNEPKQSDGFLKIALSEPDSEQLPVRSKIDT